MDESLTLADLFPIPLWHAMADGGYIRVQRHPTLDLFIANYTEKAQFERVWNAVTLACRGLIYNAAGEIQARPYPKFFNYGDDVNTGPLALDEAVIVTDKLDGSLGISYMTPAGPAVATRGSFTSDQAIHATELLRRRYPDWQPDPGYTYLWEIIYPQNRIVVDYADTDELILHGLIHNADGRACTPLHLDWPDGPLVRQFPYATLAEALAAEPRPNAEGLVVRHVDTGLMVKIKQEDYVALHRIVTGLNARTVWEWLGAGKTVGDLCATLPDDFHGWVQDIAAEVQSDADQILTEAALAFQKIADAGYANRREFAEQASQSGYLKPYLFLLLDGQTERAAAAAWREVKPSGTRSMVNHSEAVA